METSKKIPTFDQLMNPLIKALRELGGSGTTDEIYERVIEILKLPDEVLEVLHGSKGAQTEIAYRLAWARTLTRKKAGRVPACNNSESLWKFQLGK